MFGDYVFEKTAAQYTKKMMLVDADYLEEKAHYSAVFQAHGFRTVVYTCLLYTSPSPRDCS